MRIEIFERFGIDLRSFDQLKADHSPSHPVDLKFAGTKLIDGLDSNFGLNDSDVRDHREDLGTKSPHNYRRRPIRS